MRPLTFSLSALLIIAVTLGCTAEQPAGQSSAAEEAPAKPTLWIIGDSTVKNGHNDGVGWGEVLHEHFDTDRITIANRAIGGRSSRTFRLEGRWQRVLDEAKPGDFVLMQFGHNDGANPQDPQKPRGSLRGMGDETVTWHHPHLDREETIHTFGWYMRQYVREAKEHELIPIVCSYIPRAPRRNQSPKPELETYGLWAKQVAEQDGAGFLDLFGAINAAYRDIEMLKPHAVKERFFVGGDRDYTHTVRAGAEFNAHILADLIREHRGPGEELKGYLNETPSVEGANDPAPTRVAR